MENQNATEYGDKKTNNQIKLSLVEKYFQTVEEAKEIYANKYLETGKSIYYILGLTATLGDEDTWWKTGLVLGGGYLAGNYYYGLLSESAYLASDSEESQKLLPYNNQGQKLLTYEGENVLAKGFPTGKAGEEYLAKSVGGTPQQFFSTSDGARFIDQYVMKDGIAHESKVGYTSLTKSIKRQILKDAELIKGKDIKGSVWHFYKSSVTGKIGASKPLLDFLEQNGIKYEIHK